jgi:amino acid transporter
MSIETTPVDTARETVVEKPGEVWVAETPLRAGTLGLTGAIMQNVTHIAPAIAAFFFTPTLVGFAGAHSPLAYLIGFVIVLALGSCLVQLARLFPSAGGYFTYVSRTVHPRAGFLTGWAYTFYSPIVTGPIVAFFGLILEGELKANWSITFPWWVFTPIALTLITACAYYGIRLSVRTVVLLGAIEFLIVFALGLSGLADPGPGGFTFKSFDPSFNPGAIATASGFTLAVVFTVQGLTGWEAAVPLAEETENPRRNISIATLASIVIVGLMLIVVIWGQVIGWGVNDLTKLTSSDELPALVIAHRVWGDAWPFALFAMFTSVMAASLACTNVATRMWFGMGRSGALPKVVATVESKHKTPVVALAIQTFISFALGWAVAGAWGPDKIFVLSVGFCLVLAVIFVYWMGNLGVVLHYWRERRSEFNWLLHFVFPVGTSVVLGYSLVKSFTPFPASPYNWSPAIVGGWLLAGVGILVLMKIRGNEDWLDHAADIVGERPETADELEHLHRERV